MHWTGLVSGFARSCWLFVLFSFAASLGVAQEPGDFVDTWINVHPDPAGITQIIIGRDGDSLIVQAFGSCSPTDCDWGAVTVPFTGNPFEAVYELGFKTTKLTILLLCPDYLHVRWDNVFHDGTDRDYVLDDIFHRDGRLPDTEASVDDFLGSWANLYADGREIDAGIFWPYMTRAVIERGLEELGVHAFGRCEPTDCNPDWGTASVPFDANPFDATFDLGPGAASFRFRLIDRSLLVVEYERVTSGVLVRESSLGPARFIRANSNGDCRLDLTDALYTINHLFRGGPAPRCLDAADADDNGALNLTDAVYTLNYLFRGGTAPAAPFPTVGPDPTPDDLDCAA